MALTVTSHELYGSFAGHFHHPQAVRVHTMVESRASEGLLFSEPVTNVLELPPATWQGRALLMGPLGTSPANRWELADPCAALFHLQEAQHFGRDDFLRHFSPFTDIWLGRACPAFT